MNRRVLVALLVAMAFAGCTSVAPAEEQLAISITDVGNTPYVIGIPLWLWTDGPNATEWMSPDHAAIHSGQVTQFHLNETERGTAIWIAGNGTVTIGFADVRSMTTATLWDGAFTMGPGADGVRPVMFVQEGDVDVVWTYHADSEDCSAVGSFSWQADSLGWNAANFGGRMTFSPDCPR